MKTPKDKSERLNATVTGSEKTDPTLQELANIERRLRKTRPATDRRPKKNWSKMQIRSTAIPTGTK